MEGEVVNITQQRSCQVRLGNDILVVIAELATHPLKLGDRLRFVDLRLDAVVRIVNLANAKEFAVRVAAQDVHDLRLPAKHGESRTPTEERLRAL